MAARRQPKRSARPAARRTNPRASAPRAPRAPQERALRPSPSALRPSRETAAEKRARLLAEEKAAEKRRKAARKRARERRAEAKRLAELEEARRERARERARARRAAAKAAAEAAEAAEEARKERARKRARDRRAAAKAEAEAAELARKERAAARARARRAAARAAALAEAQAKAEAEAAESGKVHYPAPPRTGYERVDSLGRVYANMNDLEAERTKKFGKEVAKAARALEESLEFVASNLRVDGWTCRVSVLPNEDLTIDGDLSIEFQPGQMNKKSLTGMGGLVSRIEEHLGHVLNSKLAGFWLQYGFYLPSESQIPARDARRPYKPYDGALRFGYSYQRIARTEGAFASLAGNVSGTFVGLNMYARQTLDGVLDAHKRPPTGMYLRFHWSKDGQLHRRR